MPAHQAIAPEPGAPGASAAGSERIRIRIPRNGTVLGEVAITCQVERSAFQRAGADTVLLDEMTTTEVLRLGRPR
jgi:hypothetical protein